MAKFLSLFIALVALWAQFGSCVITQFTGLELPPNSLLESSVVMYTTKDAPLNYVVNQSSISWSFDVASKVDNSGPHAYSILLFNSEVVGFLGIDTPEGRRFCCNQDLFDQGLCFNGQLGDLIIDNRIFDTNAAIFNSFSFAQQSSSFADIEVKTTGVYRLWLINCANEREPAPADIDRLTLVISADLQFLNPYGHLSGESVPLFPYYFLLMCLFIILGAAWTFCLIRYRDSILYLQYWLTFVLWITALEMGIYAFDYYNFNKTGFLSMAFNVIEVLVGTAKRTTEWVALMMVCYGYTVIYPEMTKKTKFPLIVAAIVYAVVYFIYNLLFIIKYTPATDTSNIPETLVVLLLIVLTIFDFAFICWIFYSLFNSMAFLKLGNQPQKFKMFKTLAIVLAIAYISAFIFFCVQLAGIYGGLFDQWWRGWWCFTAFWPTLEFIIMTSIAIIWRPNANNSRYAYSAQLMDDGKGVDLPRMSEAEVPKSETQSQRSESASQRDYNDL